MSVRENDSSLPLPSSRTYSSRRLISKRVSHEVSLEVRNQFYFLTIPGIIRLLEVFLAGLHLGTFGYFDTDSDESIELAVSPFFLASTREAFFLLTNFHSFMTTFSIIISSVLSARSHVEFFGTLFVFIFDLLQFIFMTSAAVSIIFLYQGKDAKSVIGSSVATRQGLAITGMLLACLHLIGCIYDLGIYLRGSDSTAINTGV